MCGVFGMIKREVIDILNGKIPIVKFDFSEVSDDPILLFFGHCHYLRGVLFGFSLSPAHLHDVGMHAGTITESKPFDNSGSL